jgi:hypothetical protein
MFLSLQNMRMDVLPLLFIDFVQATYAKTSTVYAISSWCQCQTPDQTRKINVMFENIQSVQDESQDEAF